MIKKIISIFCIFSVIVLFSACASTDNAQKEDSSLQIVTTIFPVYDWTNNILGDNPSGVQTTMLLDSGVDLHSFQPTTEDMMKISECDLFIYVGGESDDWVDDALKNTNNKDMIVINLLDALGDQAREEELKEGMEAEAHEDVHGEEEEGPEYDEHIWLSPKNAQALCKVIQEAVVSLDPDNSKTYESNLTAYTEKINELDGEYAKAIKSSPEKTLLFGDRFPFRYLTEEYGLDYYAAFAGCSAETEASFETILFLAKKVDELGLKNVCTIEGSDQKIAKTIIENTKTKDQKILTMDSMQSVTAGDADEGASWISIMESNLDVIKEALK